MTGDFPGSPAVTTLHSHCRGHRLIPGPGIISVFQDRNQNTDNVRAKLLQSCSTLCSAMECNPPGSSVHGIFQARILEWVTMPPPGALPNPGIEPESLMSPELAGGFLATSTTLEAQILSTTKLYSTTILH